MRMFRLAFMNFRNSFKNYLSLVFSLAFTILILFHFQNIIYSEPFAVLGSRNKQYIDMLVQTVSVVLGCFMFFFLWYATNVFLTRRKREIGIYIFMGMSNRKIGSLYVIEISFVGVTALVAGVGSGALLGGLFQLIMGAVSDLAVDVRFGVSWEAVKVTGVSFLLMYFFFALKGYWNITHSSVLNMISAARQNEYVRMPKSVLLVKAVLGVVVLATGYYLANDGSTQDILANALMAVVLVIIGVYLLFGGLIPVIFQTLSANKGFLYSGQRCLWVNQMIFRMRKNYRTYAMVCIVGICSITALATGFAMKERYLVLKKLGFSAGILSASIAHELLSAYMLPFVVMVVSAYFSVYALGRMMYTSLFSVYLVSTLAVLVVFALCYILSVAVYRRVLFTSQECAELRIP